MTEDMRNVDIGPANIVTGPGQKGAAIDRCLFSKPTYNALGEPYKGDSKGLNRKDDKSAILAAGHELAFKPAKQVREKYYKASFEHMQDRTHIQKNFKSEENPRDVMIGPANIKTNPIKNGQSGR